MAANSKKSTKKVTGYEIKVKTNPDFCGVDAGGVQFAYGKALITEGRMAEWFREHDGYEVTAITDSEADDPVDPAAQDNPAE
jgi:hypothetical protein